MYGTSTGPPSRSIYLETTELNSCASRPNTVGHHEKRKNRACYESDFVAGEGAGCDCMWNAAGDTLCCGINVTNSLLELLIIPLP